ncbi:hypothetical protein [Flavobacterium cerinum]|uniref:Uncharacterized protein n=1 Tax=Flavobacterium cerinum TaxID=2502784 RepID=A0A444HC60_9FLAO|nr:hypothetical protein [Flavobacterium cerinum]RWX01054.1 hypothetical protein EPI11_08515 [Flavobacterium cerinum]
MKKHLKKLRPLLLLTTLFLLTNCQEELEESKPAVQQKNGSKYTILTGEAARAKKAELLIKLNNDGGRGLSKLQNVLKGGSTDPAFRQLMDIKEYIDDSEIFKVEQANGNINYTYRVNMPDVGDNKFYNLVVKTAGAASKTVLLTYNLSKEFAEEYQNSSDILHFSGEIEFDVVAMSDDFPCEDEPNKPTPVSGGGIGAVGGGGGGGNGGGGSGDGIDGPINPGNSGVPYNQLLVNIKMMALKFMTVKSSSIEVGPIEGGIDGGGTIPGTFPGVFDRYIIKTPSVNGETDPCGDGEDIGVLAQQKIHEDNCDELKKFAQNAKNLASLNNLKTTADNKKENGYSYSDNKDPEVLKSDPRSEFLVLVPSGGLIYGASHDHPNPLTTEFMPMFSVSDIYMLAVMAIRYQGGFKNYSKFIFTLTVQTGPSSTETFALKIDNWQAFSFFANNYYAMTNEQKKSLGDELQTSYSTLGKYDGTNSYLKLLFKFMEKQNINGVSIYKAEQNLSNWTKMSFDKINKVIKEIPCK